MKEIHIEFILFTPNELKQSTDMVLDYRLSCSSFFVLKKVISAAFRRHGAAKTLARTFQAKKSLHVVDILCQRWFAWAGYSGGG
jgi:hypothetical protein